MGEAFSDVDVLGTFESVNGTAAPFDTRGVVLVYRGGFFLRES